MEVIKDLINAGVGMATAEKKGKYAAANAKRANDDYWKRIEAANWEPEYASDHVADFKKSKSPVARAYLESFLTGTNPAMVQGTALGADQAKADATQGFTQRYGGWDQIQKEQNAHAADNSQYEVTPITRPVRDVERETDVRYPWIGEWEKKLGRQLSNEEAATIKSNISGQNKDGFGAIKTKFYLKSLPPEKLEEMYLKKGG